MPFTKEDKILIKNLFELKGYNARHLVRSFPEKVKMSVASTSCCNRYMGYWLVNRRPCSADDATPALILLTNWCYIKNGKSRNNNYLHTVLNIMILLCTKYYQNWSMSVEDIANQTSVMFEHD